MKSDLSLKQDLLINNNYYMKHFCVLLCSILLFSCSSNDDDNTNEPSLQGVWNLVNVSGGFTGLDEDFAKGIVVWDFNETTGMVTIANTATNTSVNTLLASGTYTYSISIEPNDAILLVINETSVGNFSLDNTSFFLREDFSDGFIFRFER